MLRPTRPKSTRHTTSTHRPQLSQSPRRHKGLSINTGKASFTQDLNSTLVRLSSIGNTQQGGGGGREGRGGKRGRKKLASLPGTPLRNFRSPANSSPASPKDAGPTFASAGQAEEFFESLEKPLTCTKAVDLFQSYLSEYEKIEILSYPEVFFLGLKAVKLKTFERLGFDDEHGDYHVSLWDQIAYRYETVHILGKGSFGQVLQCFDHSLQEFCALKVIRNKPRFHQQAQVEIRILSHLASKDRDDSKRVVHMKENFTFRGHLCITFELLSTNLYQFLKQNHFRGLSESLVRRFAVQILVALRFIRKEKIIHCDIKPENILLKKADRAGLKIVDFGSACFDSEKMYTYVQSRFYRAPEVLLGLPYTTAIDVWSFGCLLGELMIGLPLFPGRTEVDQLLAIMEVRGKVPQSMLISSPKRKIFFDSEGNPRVPVECRTRQRPGEISLSEVLPGASALLIDLVDSIPYSECLCWDPHKRPTPNEVLSHAWITQDPTHKNSID